MIVSCKKCETNYSVDDEKVADKKFAFTCPKCDTENVIDNRRSPRPAVTAGAVRQETRERDAGLKAAFSDEGKRREGREVGATDIPPQSDEALLEEGGFSEDDLSGLAEPEGMGDLSADIDERGPAATAKQRSDIPLDDHGLEDLELPEIDETEVKGAAEPSFEELSDGIGDAREKEIAITDELEAHEDASKPIHLDEADDIDALLSDEGKEIVDDFEPLEKEHPASRRAEVDIPFDEEIKSEEIYRAEKASEEDDLTLDLDTLDIDLEEGGSPARPGKDAGAAAGEVAVPTRATPSDEENITIDLDSLDIELEDEAKVSEGETPDDLELDISDFSDESIEELKSVEAKSETEDENITLDLDSLDISLDETGEIKPGEEFDEDETLTVEDAGLSMDELTGDELSVVTDETAPRHKGSSADELDFEREIREAEAILSESGGIPDDLTLEELNDLPDIDIDKELGVASERATTSEEDELILLDERASAPEARGGLKKELPDLETRGAVNFSIDFALKYSRLGALARLTGLYAIRLIPHAVACAVYGVLSGILAFLNNTIVALTGRGVEDFSDIHQNTLRYLLSMNACMAGVVEDAPVPAGRGDIDYPLQLSITYPARSSRMLALLRLTGIGILLAALPHIVILILMTPLAVIAPVIGLFSVLATGRWPHILYDALTRYYRYLARVSAYLIGVVDSYPPFTFN